MSPFNPQAKPKTQFGISLQSAFLGDLVQAVHQTDHSILDQLDYFQIIIDRLIGKSERLVSTIAGLNQQLPMNFHSVGLNLASPHGISKSHVTKVLDVLKHFKPDRMSDHLCLTRSENGEFHGLIPIPYSANTASIVSNNIKFLKRELGIPIAIENITTYAPIMDSEWTEIEFLTEVVTQSDCQILLDLNNLYLNQYNFLQSSECKRSLAFAKSIEYLEQVPLNNVVEVHVAGSGKLARPHLPSHHDLLIDTHGAPPEPEVIELLRILISKKQELSVTLEREANVPSLAEILAELLEIRQALAVPEPFRLEAPQCGA